MTVVAHAGHWLVPVLYASPLLVVVGLIAFAAVRDRRRERRGGEQTPRAPRA